MNLIKSVFSFVTGSWEKILAYILAVVAVFFIGGYMGYQYKDGQVAKAENKTIAVVVEGKDDRQKIANQTDTRLEDKTKELNAKVQKLQDYINANQKKLSNTSCTVNDDWVQHYNEAASLSNNVAGTTSKTKK